MTDMTYHATPLEVETTDDLPEASPEHMTDVDPLRDNNLRATWASHAVRAYAARCFPSGGEAPETVIGDLLADMRHLCDAIGVDYDDVDAAAWRRYDEEIRGEL